MQTLIHNATLVLPERLVQGGWLLIEDTRIAAIGEQHMCPDPATFSSVVDAATGFLMPGLIDLHSDAIEKLVEPRPNVHFELPLALIEADWRLAGCGITTEYHAASLDDNEFGVRSDTFVRDLADTIKAQKKHLLVRHKIHARLELTSQRGYPIIAQLIAEGAIDMVSLMDHSPGQGQYTTEEAYRTYMLSTTNKRQEEVDAILAFKRYQSQWIPERVRHVTQLARAAGLAIATHDDDTAEKVVQWPALGVTISEFPTTMIAARQAHELGLAVCMGAPNALRGKSSGGNMSAVEAIRTGIVDALCSDYYPAAMLASVFALASQQILTLPHATRLVTLNPAQAVGQGHIIGSLTAGNIADLIVVALHQQKYPLVQHVFVDGLERVGRRVHAIKVQA